MFKSEKDKKAEIKSKTFLFLLSFLVLCYFIIFCALFVVKCPGATKTAKRDISHAKRDIEKEIRTCDRQEKELTVKIQAAAKANRDVCSCLLTI